MRNSTAANLADFVRRAGYLVSLGIIGGILVIGAAVIMSAPSKALVARRSAEIAGAERASAAQPSAD